MKKKKRKKKEIEMLRSQHFSQHFYNKSYVVGCY